MHGYGIAQNRKTVSNDVLQVGESSLMGTYTSVFRNNQLTNLLVNNFVVLYSSLQTLKRSIMDDTYKR